MAVNIKLSPRAETEAQAIQDALNLYDRDEALREEARRLFRYMKAASFSVPRFLEEIASFPVPAEVEREEEAGNDG